MIKQLSNYDKRQILLLKNHLLLLQEGKINFEDFIGNLEGLFSVMENVDRSWLQAVYQHWSELETIFAWTVHKHDQPLDEYDVKSLNNSIRQIEELTDSYMKENNFSLDDEDEINKLE